MLRAEPSNPQFRYQHALVRSSAARIHADTGNPLEGARLLDEALAGLEAEIKIDPPTKPRDATSCCSPPPAPACAGRLITPANAAALRRMLDNFRLPSSWPATSISRAGAPKPPTPPAASGA